MNCIKCIRLYRSDLIKYNVIQLSRFASSPYNDVPVFKSSLSLDKIYPKSDANKKTASQTKEGETSFNGHIPINKLDISFCRSSGPGGQHLHKTNSKATVKIHLASADWIPKETRDRLEILHKNNINKEGFWVIRSEKTRAQILNVADCMDKLRCYITEASKPIPKPSEETLEMIRDRREQAAIQRLQQKRIHSRLKMDRNSVD